MRLIYSLLIYCLLPVLFGYFFWRSLREPDYRRGWLQRLGFVPRTEQPSIWLHVASVGETQAALPLIERLIERYPDHRIVVTSFTPTGSALVSARLGERVSNVYLPVDTPCAVARFLRRLRPRIGVIVETELWPNLLLGCKARAIPMVLASATLSEKSARRYLRSPMRGLMSAALQAFHIVTVQSAPDAERFGSLGVRQGRIELSGNLKFDLSVDESLPGQAATLRHNWQAGGRAVWLAASTHEGEEEQVIATFRQLQTRHPNQLLILVPRHLQRFDSVAGIMEKSGLNFVRRSQGETVDSDTEVVLVDSLGELMLFYAMADVAFVAGSLTPIGGHNLLEPAALAKPIVTGPYCESQQQLLDLLAARDAVVQVDTQEELATTIAQLLEDGNRRKEMGQAAQAVVTENRGALSRIEGAVARSMLHSARPTS
ncbi:MAG: lipid IV(A) 3-deoxy-D-manno-octulosonic acid transferase [Salinisphaeraceae bacterium]|nr:lipid IV(A) 3-deoxy-D-manno-octulosonic acid transferase [Salinisphaeraceae bacterium]